MLIDNAVAVTDQVHQQVEHLRFQRDWFAAPPQFAARHVEHVPPCHVAGQVAALQAAAAGSARAVHSLAIELSAAPAAQSAAERAAVVALAATRAAVQVTGDVIQLHGGYGYIADYPCERWFRDCVSLRALLSASLPGRPRAPVPALPQFLGTTAAS